VKRLSPIAAALAAALTTFAGAGSGAAPKFFPDDPIARDVEGQDASGVQPWDASQLYDAIENSVLGAGDRVDIRALNINTIDEVPNSSWFTNRAGARPMTIADLVRGPDRSAGPAPGVWLVTGKKTEGVTPGLTITDGKGDKYWIKFDPKSNPEMASGAEVISTKLFHAFGYHVPENYIATFRREDLRVAPGAKVLDEDRREQDMTAQHVDEVLDRAAKNEDGTYRALASLNLPGEPRGPFKYYGTRPDDPNDIFAHEHRRELRGLEVFSAWLNHDEVRSGNSLDTLVRDGDRMILRHNLLDFGSTLGSGSVQAQSRRAGNEFVWEARPTLITMLTLGFYVRPWIKVPYPDLPAVGRFESTYFRPELWKPDYPNPAFKNARPEDRFWAARIVAAIPDEAVRAIVETARYSDARAAAYLVETLLARKSKVLRSWLNTTNPVVHPTLSASGVLTFENAAAQAGVAKAAERYTIEWSRFDNTAQKHEWIGSEQAVRERRAEAPQELLAGRPPFVAARIRAFHPDQPAWSEPLLIYFRRADEAWTLVGLERGQ
jgi:hypothetical protein